MNNKQEQQFGKELLHWEIPEFQTYERSKLWYVIAVIVSVGLIIYALSDRNYLFALIIVMFLVITISTNAKKPKNIDVVITSYGIGVGDRFYNYDDFHSFSIIYKPEEKLKMLYLEFASKLHPRISISLKHINPITLREILSQRIQEDLNRTDEPNTDYFSRKLKI